MSGFPISVLPLVRVRVTGPEVFIQCNFDRQADLGIHPYLIECRSGKQVIDTGRQVPEVLI